MYCILYLILCVAITAWWERQCSRQKWMQRTRKPVADLHQDLDLFFGKRTKNRYTRRQHRRTNNQRTDNTHLCQYRLGWRDTRGKNGDNTAAAEDTDISTSWETLQTAFLCQRPSDNNNGVNNMNLNGHKPKNKTKHRRTTAWSRREHSIGCQQNDTM